MDKKITEEDVIKIAKLAKLELTKQEISRYSMELTEIIEYVQKLNTVKTTGLDPTVSVNGLCNISRSDQQIDYRQTPASLLGNVPRVKDNFIQVKRVIE
ncbi:MAG: Asp-tRNA(Asn)/Glu-tRNA(Gln) amidotransferase subunit GatC [Patescibacteria group bacterium]|nr:Asp-tRNA(Asn)/Glu-tRNA(Gln) amidotransferase subunit GatC [Patescibacteria group bacterium]